MLARLTVAPAVCLASLLVACVPSSPVSTPADTDHTWQIVGHRLPGRATTEDPDRNPWHGAFVHLQPQRAMTAGEACHGPLYTTSTHAAASYLAEEYDLTPTALGVPEAATVHVIDVTCQGRPWAMVGGRVLSFGGAGDFAVRDGVFYQLKRVHL